MYRCEICKTVSPPGQGRKTHVVWRDLPARRETHRDQRGAVLAITSHPARREIAAEIPVCVECHKELEGGRSLQSLRKEYAIKGRAPIVGETAPLPKPKIKAPPKVSGGRKATRRPEKPSGKKDVQEFRAAYERLSRLGKCDSPEGMEYRRVLKEWETAGRPDNLDEFILARANVGPSEPQETIPVPAPPTPSHNGKGPRKASRRRDQSNGVKA